MPKTKNLSLDTLSATDLLRMLPPDRRAALIQDVLDHFVRASVEDGATIEQLVGDLPRSALWADIKGLPAAAILRATDGGRPAAPPAAKVVQKRGPGRPPKAKPAAAKKPAAKKARPGVRTFTDGDLAKAIDVIGAKPGLRPAEYRTVAGIDERVWENLIYKLKQDGKIKVVGKGRSTSYLVA